MECRTALERLESVGSDLAGLEAAEFAAAAQHVWLCGRCDAVFGSRRRSDEILARAMRNVPVPPGLKQDLLDLLVGREAVLPARVGRSSRQDSPDQHGSRGIARPEWRDYLRLNRRTWLRHAALSLVCGIGVIGVWRLFVQMLTHFPVSELCRLALAAELDTLPQFQGNFEPVLPSSRWVHLVQNRRPRGIPTGRPAVPEIAVYQFTMVRPRRARVSGCLLVLPGKHVAQPLPGRFADAETIYPDSPPGRRIAGLAWTSGRFAYICLVDGALDELNLVRGALSVAPA